MQSLSALSLIEPSSVAPHTPAWVVTETPSQIDPFVKYRLLNGLDDQSLRDLFAYLRIPQPITP